MGLFSGIGGFLNDITGASSSQNKNFQQTKYLNNLSYEQQKEFAQNSHQWEMQDLQKAGINPALTAAGSSAGSIAGGGATSGSGGNASSGLDVLTSIQNTINNTRLTNAQIKQINAQTDNIDEDTENKEWENKFWKWGENGVNWFKNMFNNNDNNKNDTNSAKKQVFTKNMLLGE